MLEDKETEMQHIRKSLPQGTHVGRQGSETRGAVSDVSKAGNDANNGIKKKHDLEDRIGHNIRKYKLLL